MCCTCKYANHMSKMIQLRNVPEALHRKLKARAAMAGLSLSDYLITEIKQSQNVQHWKSFESVYTNVSPCGYPSMQPA